MADQSKRLENRVAIVTGGGRGIGKAIALAYAAEGARVALVARSSAEIEGTAHEVEAQGCEAIAVPADVSQPEQVSQMVKRVAQKWGTVDILVNAAGLRAVYPTEELPFERWQEVLQVNLTGSLLCSQNVFSYMQNQAYGKIIMIGSMQAHSGAPQRAAYVASKTGLLGLTRALGVEWARHKINVNMLSPGYIDTDIIRKQVAIGQLDMGAIIHRTPLGRLGKMEDLTGPAIFLASHEFDFMCGQALVIDGGWLAYGFLQS